MSAGPVKPAGPPNRLVREGEQPGRPASRLPMELWLLIGAIVGFVLAKL